MQRVRVTLLIPDGGRLLFVREPLQSGLLASEAGSDEPSAWQLPGGGLDPGESIYECAVREAREEAGLSVRPERITHIHELLNPAEPFFQLSVFVLVSVLAGTPRPPEGDEVLELRYLSQAEARGVDVVSWCDIDELWDDVARGFGSFQHLGTQRVAADGGRATYREFPG